MVEIEDIRVQVRSESEGMEYFETINEAFRFADRNPSFWKISFRDFDGTRVRLIKWVDSTPHGIVLWKSEPIQDEIEASLGDLRGH